MQIQIKVDTEDAGNFRCREYFDNNCREDSVFKIYWNNPNKTESWMLPSCREHMANVIDWIVRETEGKNPPEPTS